MAVRSNMRLINLLSAFAVCIVAAAPTTALAQECALDGIVCTSETTEGDPDCSAPRAYSVHTKTTTVTAGEATVTLTEQTACFPTREGGIDTATTRAEANAAGVTAGAEYFSFTDHYWGNLAYEFREAHVFVVLPDGTELGAWHAEGDFTDPTFPEQPYCSTGAYVDDQYVEGPGCLVVAPLILVP